MPSMSQKKSNPKYVNQKFKVSHDKTLFVKLEEDGSFCAKPLGVITKISTTSKYVIKSGDPPVPVFQIAIQEDSESKLQYFVFRQDHFYAGTEHDEFTPCCTQTKLDELKKKYPKGNWFKQLFKHLDEPSTPTGYSTTGTNPSPLQSNIMSFVETKTTRDSTQQGQSPWNAEQGIAQASLDVDNPNSYPPPGQEIVLEFGQTRMSSTEPPSKTSSGSVSL